MLKITTLYKSIKRDIYLWYVDPIVFFKIPIFAQRNLENYLYCNFLLLPIYPLKKYRDFFPLLGHNCQHPLFDTNSLLCNGRKWDKNTNNKT